MQIRDRNPEEPVRLIVGASSQTYPGWIQTQEDELNLLKREDWERTFGNRKAHAILAEHVWEHLSYEGGLRAAQICFDYLEKGGYIRCAVPDGYFPDETYQRTVQIGGPGPSDHPAASHKIVHTYKTLTRMFEEAGFFTNLLEYCDENGAFHAANWNPADGFIYRSKRFDHRNRDGKLGFVSLIVDAVKR